MSAVADEYFLALVHIRLELEKTRVTPITFPA
jgi:hypothetical protein